jgi:hypothetical protein
MRKDMISATRRFAKIARVLISGASISKLRNEVLGLDPLYWEILLTDQRGGERLEKQVPPPCSVTSGVTQVEESVTTICSTLFPTDGGIELDAVLSVAFISN